MNAKLIATTVPCPDLVAQGIKTGDDLIAYCARVSNPSNQTNTATAPKLLAYCIRHGHWSVFETASMTVEVETSRAIAAQLLRHRSFTFQEFSQRYAAASEFEPVELRKQDKKNRQASGDPMDRPVLDAEVKMRLGDAKRTYDYLISRGVSKETARMVLPLATRTRLYMTGCVRSWIHYFDQRCSEHTQREHMLLAYQIARIFAAQFPKVWMAQQLREGGGIPPSLRFYRQVLKKSVAVKP
jgi:thymidylate synthase (FAD)